MAYGKIVRKLFFPLRGICCEVLAVMDKVLPIKAVDCCDAVIRLAIRPNLPLSACF